MIRLRICAIGLSLLCLAGCATPKDYGVLPWEIYDEPAAITLTAEEQGLLDGLQGIRSPESIALGAAMTPDELKTIAKFQSIAAAAMKKIMLQKNAWRATVQKHNEKARQQFIDQNKKLLGYSDEQIKKLTGAK